MGVQGVKKATDEGDDQEEGRLVARVAYLPFRAPVRITMIMFVTGSGAVQTIYVSGRSAAGVAYDKQQQFAQAVLQRAKPLTDKVGSMSETTLARARKGRDAVALKVTDGCDYVTVLVNGMVVRLKLVEAKNWTSDKVDRARAGTVAVVVKGVEIAHQTTGRVIGRERATYLFTSLYLPVEVKKHGAVTPIVHASTTGDVPKSTAAKVAEIKSAKVAEVTAPVVGNGAIAG